MGDAIFHGESGILAGLNVKGRNRICEERWETTC